MLYFWKAGGLRISIMIIISSYQFEGAYSCPMDVIFFVQFFPAILQELSSFALSQVPDWKIPNIQQRVLGYIFWHFYNYIWMFLRGAQPTVLVNLCPLRAVWQMLSTGVPWRSGQHAPQKFIQSRLDSPSIHFLVRGSTRAWSSYLVLARRLKRSSGILLRRPGIVRAPLRLCFIPDPA